MRRARQIHRNDDIAHVGYGVAYQTGAPKPDVSTPDALKQALLQAQSITLYPDSAAGAYVMNVFDRLGIGEVMKTKIKPQPTGVSPRPWRRVTPTSRCS